MQKHIRKILTLFTILTLNQLIASQTTHAVENPLFGYTHLLASPFTLPAGRIMVGTISGIGITDFLEVDTNLIADFYKIYNGTARLSLLDFPGVAVGLSLGYQSVNLHDLSISNPDASIRSWMPGGVIGMEVVPYLAVFLGGNLFYSNVETTHQGINTSGYLQGAQIESDISWAYNPHQDRTGNVLSGGVSYNTTFDLFGFGVSHHWKGFHFGVHYYPNATNYKILPIIAGGAAFEI